MNKKNLFPCKTCGKEIAITAKICPHCGDPEPIKSKDIMTDLKRFYALPFHEQISKAIQLSLGFTLIFIILGFMLVALDG